MTVIVKLKKWTPLNGVTHKTTSWVIATDNLFKNIILSVPESDKLEMLYTDIVIPVNVTYYAKAKRHFTDSNLDYWTDVIELTNIENEHSVMILSKEVKVDKPDVYVSAEEVHSDKDFFTVRTSKFRCRQDGHGYTHWAIKDENDKILFRSLKDTVNKTSILVPNLLVYKDANKLKFIAIHSTSNGIESAVGYTTINLHDVNFKINTEYNTYKPYKDLIVNIIPVDDNKDMRINNITVRDVKTGKELLYIDTRVNELFDNELTIPWNRVLPERTLSILVSCYNNNGRLITVRKDITVLPNRIIDDIVFDKKYRNTLSSPTVVTNLRLSNHTSTVELPNGDIIAPLMFSNRVHVLRYNQTTRVITDTGSSLPGVTLLRVDNEFTNLVYLENDTLLIDTRNAAGAACFMVYKYNRHANIYTLVKTLVRSTENTASGFTGSLIQVSDNEFVYSHGKHIKKYDILKNVVTDLITIDHPNVSKLWLLKITNNRILIINNITSFTNVYNVATNKLSEGPSLTPGSFVGLNDIKIVKLLNGNYLIFKTITNATENETSIIQLDTTKVTFNNLDIKFDAARYSTAIRLINGNILFTSLIIDKFSLREFE